MRATLRRYRATRCLALAGAALLLASCAPQALPSPPHPVGPQLLLVRVDAAQFTLLGRGFGAKGALVVAVDPNAEEPIEVPTLLWSPERVEAPLPEGLAGGWVWIAVETGVSLRFPWRRP